MQSAYPHGGAFSQLKDEASSSHHHHLKKPMVSGDSY